MFRRHRIAYIVGANQRTFDRAIDLVSARTFHFYEMRPKVADLRPLASCNSLEILEYSGDIWNRNRAETLEPIGRLPSLKALRLLHIAVNSGGLEPLSEAKTLPEMELSNQFPTDDYAFPAAHLPHAECNLLRPYVKLESAIDGKDTMVVGRRKPLLNMKHDSAKLENYVREFEVLQRSYEE